MKLQHQSKKLMALIIAPFVILVIGYGLVYRFVQPAIRPFLSIYSLISSEYGPSFDDAGQNLYNGKQNDTKKVALLDLPFPNYGDEFGEIHIDRVGLTTRLFYGDSDDILLKGAGLFAGSFLPGFNKTILIAGHTIPYFQKLGGVMVGDEIEIATNYGTYTYTVTGTKVGRYDDGSMYDLSQTKKEQLILYTCYPLDGIGFKTERLFVYADKKSGPIITGLSSQ